jgi:hypothetical protein
MHWSVVIHIHKIFIWMSSNMWTNDAIYDLVPIGNTSYSLIPHMKLQFTGVAEASPDQNRSSISLDCGNHTILAISLILKATDSHSAICHLQIEL